MPKSGWKTTEFYVTVLFDAALVITELTSANLVPVKYATLAAGIANGLYAISRGLAKVNAPAPVPSPPAPPAPGA